MATVTAKTVVELVRHTLNDADRVRWSDSDLLSYLNAGQREIVIHRPDASTRVLNLTVVLNQSLQDLPVTVNRLLKITRNMGAGGTTPGTPIRLANHDELDSVLPTWHTQIGAYVKNYTYDGKSPKVFYVCPNVQETIEVEAHVSMCPADCTINGVDDQTVNSVLSIDDLYQTALEEYMVMCAHKKDTDARDDAKAGAAFNSFLNRLGLKVIADKAADPNRNAPPKERAQDVGSPDAKPTL